MTDEAKAAWLTQPDEWGRFYECIHNTALGAANDLAGDGHGYMVIDEDRGLLQFAAECSDTFDWASADVERLSASETVHFALCMDRYPEPKARLAYIYARRGYEELPSACMKPEEWAHMVEPMREQMASATKTISGDRGEQK